MEDGVVGVDDLPGDAERESGPRHGTEIPLPAGDALLAPQDPGGIALHRLAPGGDLLLTSGAYLAADVGVELVGASSLRAEQARLEQLERVFLEGAPVRSAGAQGEVASLAPRLQEVDVSGSLFGSWADAAALAAELPKLSLIHI